MGTRVVTLCIVWAAFGLIREVSACTLIGNSTVEAEFRESANVVLARIMGGSRTAQSDDPSADYAVETVEFEVLVTWKGSYKEGATLTTKTPIGPGSCGRSVDPNLRLLVGAPTATLKPGDVWVLFLGESTFPEVSSSSGSLGDGSERKLKQLFELSAKRR